ncbi:arylsulfatase [Mesorhizobium sp. M0195]|uniref:arylsulfatase n=1 Tax=Mesorhizobium sp. M0195 TaxID=2956910 RepID=UPI00333DC47D
MTKDRNNPSPVRVNRRSLLLGGTSLAASALGVAGASQIQAAQAQNQPANSSSGRQPNILVIWGDDIGWQNVSAYGMGTMGYTTPNIDRVGLEGIRFTDHYAQNSCTAGRASFITGQYPIRSGMVTVGVPGDKLGLQAASPCLAEVLKKAGYATGHFGKNHLGDRNEHLPTAHGFDEFFGNLYHLNTQEQPEYRDYQEFAKAYPGGSKAFANKYGTRGVLHSVASDTDDVTEDPRFGRIGKQIIEDTGPLTIERMKDFDAAEVIPKAFDFMKKANGSGKPFFVWLNTSRMHLYTHLNDKWRYAADKYTYDEDIHGSGMLQHDHDIGLVLDWLKENGLEDDTIVWYSTDNGPEHSSWPWGGTTPFRGEKMTTYEGGVRVISMLRWPGVIKAGQVLNGIQAHMDMFTSFAAAAGEAGVVELMKSEKKQYIDGVNNLNYWTGKALDSSRTNFFYYYESKLMAIRISPWKVHFQTRENYYDIIRPQLIFFNIRADPFESYDSIDSFGHLEQRVSWLFQPMNELVGEHLKTLAQYPPVQGGSSFDMSNVVEDFLRKSQQ